MTNLLTQDVVPPSPSYNSVRRGPKRKHLSVGEVFGNRVVIESGLIVLYRGSMHSASKVRCICGSEKIIPNTLLRDLGVTSCGCREHAYKADSDWRLVFCFARHAALNRSRPVEFNLSMQDVKIIGLMPCAYCGVEYSNILYKTKRMMRDGKQVRATTGEIRIKFNGIDRIDSLTGYHLGNVVPCCKFCNFAKIDSSLTIFLERIARFGSKLTEGDVYAVAERIKEISALGRESKVPPPVRS